VEKYEGVVEALRQKMIEGSIPPWRGEDELVRVHNVPRPDHFRLAALARKGFIEHVTGERFDHLEVMEKPYILPWVCEADGTVWNLEAQDRDLHCSLCGRALKRYEGPDYSYAPLVASYVAGQEDYISYCGRITVKGDVNKKFLNLTAMGPGMSAIGLARGCFLIDRYGGAEVKVEERAGVARCMGFGFATSDERARAAGIIKEALPRITTLIDGRIAKVGGKVTWTEFLTDNFQEDYYLYVCFYADTPEFRAHGEMGWSVGAARELTNEILREKGVDFNLSVIAQGYDGDYMPSPGNRRGRHAIAQVRLPVKEMEALLGRPVDRFLAFIEMDRRGAEKLGSFGYTGMGAEIISGLYKATRVNPRMPLTSCLQRIFTFLDKGDLVYGIELPTLEVGVLSSIEGGVPPTGREVLRIMGIRTAREFSANLAAQVLAGEFNLAVEIVREKLYSTQVSRLY